MCLDLIQHSLYLPETYHRRFDFDLDPLQEEIKQVALMALPLISLYRPAGFVLSLSMNGMRLFSHLKNGIEAGDQRDWIKSAVEAGKVVLTLLSLALLFTSFTPALFMTTGFDLFQSMASFYGKVTGPGQLAESIDEGLQMATSAIYLGFMATGMLELMVIFSLLQAITCFYQGYQKQNWFEVGVKLVLGSIRLHQAYGYVGLIQKRNHYLSLKRIQSVFENMIRGRSARHLLRHPLSSLKSRIEANNVSLVNGQGEEVSFGSHFHGSGGALVKGENLAFRTKMVQGKEITEVDFKVNHAFRSRIDEAIKELKGIKSHEMRDLLALSGSHVTNIAIEEDVFFSDINIDYPLFAKKIHLEGLGSILVGSSKEAPTLYDRVVVQLEAHQSLFELHEVLSFVSLDGALNLSTPEDIERLKMGHLFRTFFPRQATPFERTEEFFSLSLESLKTKMIEKAPEMEEVFETYYERMQEEHLVDGRIRYRITGLAEAARKEGAKALTAAILGAYKDEDLYDRVASMLKIGMLSKETRDINKINKNGLGGSGMDYLSGGADSVFTQLVTERHCHEKLNWYEFVYQSKVRVLISLDALEMGSYQYYTDSFGNRLYQNSHEHWFSEKYAERDNILEFIQKQQNEAFFYEGNEVMIKERVAPSFFSGLVVPDEQTKRNLVRYLESHDIVQNGQILNRSVDQFIHVSTSITEDLFNV